MTSRGTVDKGVSRPVDKIVSNRFDEAVSGLDNEAVRVEGHDEAASGTHTVLSTQIPGMFDGLEIRTSGLRDEIMRF